MIALAGGVAACNTIWGPETPDSNWRIHDTPRFSLHVRPGTFAELHVEQFGAVLEDQHAFITDRLDVRYEGRLSGFLYDASDNPGPGLAFPDTRAFALRCVPPLNDNLLAALAHEASHVILRGTLGRPGTYFIDEGGADAFLSERFHARGRSFLYRWTKTHRTEIPPLSSLIDDSKWTSYPAAVAYSASASFLAYLVDTYGPSGVKQLFNASSRQFDERFIKIYKRSVTDVERDWYRFCDTFS